MNLNKINFYMIAMDLLIVLSPFWSAELLSPETSVFFLGFSLVYLFLHIRNGKLNKQRYINAENV